MNTKMAIAELGITHGEYLLNQSQHPNHIIKWESSEPQPTQEELEAAWASFLEKNPDWAANPDIVIVNNT